MTVLQRQTENRTHLPSNYVCRVYCFFVLLSWGLTRLPILGLRGTFGWAFGAWILFMFFLCALRSRVASRSWKKSEANMFLNWSSVGGMIVGLAFVRIRKELCVLCYNDDYEMVGSGMLALDLSLHGLRSKDTRRETTLREVVSNHWRANQRHENENA